MRITVVDFAAAYGQKEENLEKMERVLRRCRGKTDLVVFPEMALTGYENEPERCRAEKMQIRLAEPVPGPSTRRLAAVCRETGLYTAFGLPERGGDRVYNAAALLSPDGQCLRYEKMHLPDQEPEWAAPGDQPLVAPTPWGPVAVLICYDVYKFPELVRQARRRGARLILNLTACAAPIPPAVIQLQTAFAAQSEGVCIASANLTGHGRTMEFFGGSHILAPGERQVRLLAGRGFERGTPGEESCWTAELPEFLPEGSPFAPERSAGAWRELLKDPRWKASFRPCPEPPERQVTVRLCAGPEEAEAAKEELLLLAVESQSALSHLAGQCRRKGQCAAVCAGRKLYFLQPSGISVGENALAAETPWGLAGLVTDESMEAQFEEYRALRARGARMLLVPGGKETRLLRLAEETACVTAEVPVVGPRRILLPFGPERLPRELGPAEIVPLRVGAADRRLHVFSRNPLTGRPDLRPECYLRLWEEGR